MPQSMFSSVDPVWKIIQSSPKQTYYYGVPELISTRYVWNDRKQFGQLVGEFQGMQHQMAQAYTEIAAARGLLFNAARKKEAGEDFVRDAAMAKLYSSQVAGKVSGQAIEWMGGMGFVREGIAEKMFRDSKIGAIYEGTSNIQLQTIAKLLQKEYTM